MEPTQTITKKNIPSAVKIIAVLYTLAGILGIMGIIGVVGFGSMFPLLAVFGIFLVIPLIVMAVLGFVVAKGLRRGKEWARITAILIGIIQIISALVQHNRAFIFSLLIQIVIVAYLAFNHDVKKAFQTPSPKENL